MNNLKENINEIYGRKFGIGYNEHILNKSFSEGNFPSIIDAFCDDS